MSGADRASDLPTLAELSDTYARLAVGHSPDRSQEWRNWIVRRRSDGQAVGTVQATIAAHVHPAHQASAAVPALTPSGTYHDGEQLWRRPVP